MQMQKWKWQKSSCSFHLDPLDPLDPLVPFSSLQFPSVLLTLTCQNVGACIAQRFKHAHVALATREPATHLQHICNCTWMTSFDFIAAFSWAADGSNERHQKVEKGVADAKVKNVLKKRSGIGLGVQRRLWRLDPCHDFQWHQSAIGHIGCLYGVPTVPTRSSVWEIWECNIKKSRIALHVHVFWIKRPSSS